MRKVDDFFWNKLRSFQHQANAQRVEPAVKGAIMTVDGWLALNSSGMYRLFAADDVRKFMGSGDFEVVMAEFVALHASATTPSSSWRSSLS